MFGRCRQLQSRTPCVWRGGVGVFLALLLWGIAAPVFAQNGAMSKLRTDAAVPPPAHFRTITTRDGLSHPAIFAIGQDAFGFMWLGTVATLDRFDGFEVRGFHPAATEDSLTCSGPKLSVYVDRQDRVWSGALGQGACMYDTHTGVWRAYFTNDGVDPRLSALSVRDFLQDAAGGLWMATSAGLAYLETGSDSPRVYRHALEDANDAAFDDLTGLALDKAGRLWLATRNGLAIFDPVTQQFTHYQHDPADPASLSSNRIFDVLVDRQGMVWVATWDGGLNRLDPQTGKVRRFRHDADDPGSLSSDQLMKVLEDRAGRIWIGAYGGGLNLFDVQSERFIHYQHDPDNPWSLSHDQVVALFEDNTGNLWIGTEGGGVSILNLNPPPFTFYRRTSDSANTLPPGLVTALAEDSTGALWVGANVGGLSRLERTTEIYTHFSADTDAPDSLSSDVVSSLLFDRNGVLWVGTAQGVNRFDATRNRFTHYRHDPADPSSLTDDSIYAMVEDADGTLWIGAYGGLNHFDPNSGKVKRYTHDPADPNSLSANSVRVILAGVDDDLWVGTQNGGLNRFSRTTGQATRYHSAPADPATLSGNGVTALARDARGMIWIGTEGNGLNCLDPQTGVVTRFGQAEGLPDMRVLALAYIEDASGRTPGALWMSTGAGLSHFDLQRATFQNYGVDDGLPEAGFVPYSFYQSERGELFFAGLDSVVAFDPAALQDAMLLQAAPRARVTELFIDNKPAPIRPDSRMPTAIFASAAITLPAEVETFTLGFAAPGYWGVHNLRFRYRLQGFNQDWVEAHPSQRGATYTNLKPGDYQFIVQAAGRDRVWNPTGDRLEISLEPEWWEVWWVLPSVVSACGGLAVALLTSGFQMRLRKSKRQNQLLEQEVTERTAELSALLAVSQSITSARDLEPLLVSILTDMRSTILHADTLVLLQNSDESTLLAYRLFQNETTLTAHALPQTIFSLLLQVVQTGRSFTLQELALHGSDYDSDCDNDCECLNGLLDLLPACQADDHWMGALLHARAENIGMLLLFARQPSRFDPAVYPSLQRFANQVAIAVDNARLYAQSQQLAVEVERSRLSRELHDSVTQFLHSISLHADASARALALQKPETGVENMHEVQRLARDAMQELRTLIFDLRSTAIQEHGLHGALASYGESVMARSELVVSLEIDYPNRLPEAVEFELYRIAQEALTNTAKHAYASHVSITLREEFLSPAARRIRLEVVDDGVGFEVGAAHRHSAIGLSSMAERAAQIGAQLTIDSQPGRGTAVKVEVLR